MMHVIGTAGVINRLEPARQSRKSRTIGGQALPDRRPKMAKKTPKSPPKQEQKKEAVKDKPKSTPPEKRNPPQGHHVFNEPDRRCNKNDQ